ncbi:MAG: sodium:solute symporter family protein [Desulfacinum sp.]|jgi:SSS family transporter|nr:sodium:solute symporter family protein [Desulfacinum sp.]
MEGSYQYGGWVLVGLGIYMVLMLLVGWYASKKVQGTEDYLVAGRRLGLFLCTGTLFATWFGSGTCMGGAGNAYIFGNQGVIFDPWGAALCLFLAGFFFARLMRRGRYLTLVDLFQLRYGNGMGMLSAISLTVAEMGWVGAQLVGFGTIIHFFSGLPLGWGIAISTLILVVYTYLGGMWSVTLTDVFQMIILTVGMIVMLVVAVPLAGGWGEIFSSHTSNMMELPTWSFLPEKGDAGFLYYTGYVGWFYWLAAWMAIGLGSIPAQDLMQRMLSAGDEKVASYSSYLAGLLYVTVGMMPVVIGLIYFKLNPNLGPEDALNKILLFMATDHLSPFFAVVFVSALVAALMSSSDSAILAASSMVGYNAYKILKPEVTTEQTLKATRIAVPIVTGISLILALYFEAIYNLMVISWSVLLVSLFAPYVAAYFWKGANRLGALASYVAGFVAWIVGYYAYLPMTLEANKVSPDCLPPETFASVATTVEGVGQVYFDWAMWDALYISSVWGLIASVVALVAVSLLTRSMDPPMPLVDIDGEPMPVRNWMGIFGKA